MSIYIVLLVTLVCISLIVYINPKLKIKKGVESKTSNHPSDNLEKYRNLAHQENKTLICISHKLSNLKNMDKIIILKKGKIDKIVEAKDINSYIEQVNFN